MNKKYILMLTLFILSGILYYVWATNQQTTSSLQVIDITDGDTIKLKGDIKVRLLGINTPEKGMLNAEKPEEYLKQTILNQKVQIVHQGTDRYGRILGYIFLNNQNINQKILEQGYAHLYYYDKDKYYQDMLQAETNARQQGIGIWKESPNQNCIHLLELQYNDDKYGEETLTLQNNCQKQIDVTIKDDATHIYKRTLDTVLPATRTVHTGLIHGGNIPLKTRCGHTCTFRKMIPGRTEIIVNIEAGMIAIHDIYEVLISTG